MTTSLTPSSALSPFGRWLLAACGAALAVAAIAQQPPPIDEAGGIDPPGRVARVDLVEGSMSYASGREDDWSSAALNRPLTAGDRLWTAERSRAEIHVGSTAARLGSETALNLIAVDDDSTQLQLTQGTVSLRVRSLADGQRLQIDTPNLAFVAAQPGEYRIDVDPSRNATRVAVLSGGGAAYGQGGVYYTLNNGLQVTFGNTNLMQLGVQNVPPRDAFDAWVAARDHAEEQSIAARYVSREVIGYQQLDQYGDWASDASYGNVWYPRAVAADWAPYRAGHWEFIDPWGWTWIDDAPWGFAPFHYGRWAYVGNRWGWVPGPVARRAVYAPALVGFIGGSGASLSFAVGGQPSVGWFPLGPGEAWQPYYRASPRYVNRVNYYVVNNNYPRPNRGYEGYRFQHAPHAVTAVRAEQFQQGRPIRNDWHRFREDDLRRNQVVTGPSVQPDRGRDGGNRGWFGGRDNNRPAGQTPPAAVTQRDALVQRAAADRPPFRSGNFNNGPRGQAAVQAGAQSGGVIGIPAQEPGRGFQPPGQPPQGQQPQGQPGQPGRRFNDNHAQEGVQQQQERARQQLIQMQQPQPNPQMQQQVQIQQQEQRRREFDQQRQQREQAQQLQQQQQQAQQQQQQQMQEQRRREFDQQRQQREQAQQLQQQQQAQQQQQREQQAQHQQQMQQQREQQRQQQMQQQQQQQAQQLQAQQQAQQLQAQQQAQQQRMQQQMQQQQQQAQQQQAEQARQIRQGHSGQNERNGPKSPRGGGNDDDRRR